MTREETTNDDDFITKTKHRKKQQSRDDAKNNADDGKDNGDGISLRPRTMFAMKGRGRTESENGSPYRPQWSKDGEGFVSSTSKDSVHDNESSHRSGMKDEIGRRKSKVLRYTRDELLSLHVLTKGPPKFPPETVVASEHCLPPVGTLPFDYEEIYKQWALNRNRGRGRGRGTNASGQTNTNSSSGDRNRSNDGNWGSTTKKEENDGDDSNLWERGAKPSDQGGLEGDDIWDDVGNGGAGGGELDLSSMAEAAEKFRREMDALRQQSTAPEVDLSDAKDNLDVFDQKLEDAAKAGQFDDSDDEVQWDMPDSSGKKEEQSTFSFESPMLQQQPQFESPESNHPASLESSTFALHSMMTEQFNLSQLTLEVKDEWFYLDPQGLQQGPFKTAEMREWFEAGYFKPHLPIRFGREGGFTPLASHFLQGQLPFAAPPRVSPKAREDEQQRLMALQQQQQQQQMMQLQQQQQQQQEHQRLLQEEKMRMEMQQRMEMARHQQNQLFQHQMMQQQQQQQHMLLQQQSSWQRSQREGIMSALGIFGGNQDAGIPSKDNFGSGMQMQFQSTFGTQQHADTHTTGGILQNSLFGATEHREQQSLWPQSASPLNDMMGPLDMFNQQRSSPTSTKAPEMSLTGTIGDAWGNRTELTGSLSLNEIQNEEKRRAAEEVVQQSFDKVEEPTVPAVESTPKPESPVASTKKDKDNAKVSPIKKNVHPVAKSNKEAPKSSGPWAGVVAETASSKSLREIQEEEQRQMRKKMEIMPETANLAQMGTQLKMMLGVEAGAAPSSESQPTQTSTPASAPSAPAASAPAAAPARTPAPAAAPQKPAPKPTPAPAPAPTPTPAPAPSAWNTAPAQSAQVTKKSMRDILAEEERLAQERAKRTDGAASSSHWSNIVAGTASATTMPKSTTRSLGPVPASVLKSTRQLRTATGADASAAAKKTTPSKAESDASFWNFGAAAKSNANPAPAQVSVINAFGSSSVSTELMAWCAKQLESMGGIENLTLMEYCASLEDPGEIREYLAAYLGSTPKVSAFATEFIQRKKQMGSTKKSPSNAIKPTDNNNQNDAAANSKKTKRRTKGQKIDPSLLNYSVGS